MIDVDSLEEIELEDTELEDGDELEEIELDEDGAENDELEETELEDTEDDEGDELDELDIELLELEEIELDELDEIELLELEDTMQSRYAFVGGVNPDVQYATRFLQTLQTCTNVFKDVCCVLAADDVAFRTHRRFVRCRTLEHSCSYSLIAFDAFQCCPPALQQKIGFIHCLQCAWRESA